MKIRFLIALLAVFSMQLAGNAIAQESGGYIGYKLGFYDYSHNGRSDNEFAQGIYGGYRFSKYIAAEVEYLSLMETSEAASFEGDAGVASIKPSLPLGENWEIYAKLGWAWIDADINPKKEDEDNGATRESVEDDFANYGLGVGLTIGRFQGRLEYQFDEWDNSFGGPDLGIFSLGMNFNF